MSGAAWLAAPGAVVVVAVFVIVRWLVSLERRARDHAERISWVEAKVNGKGKATPP